MRPAPTGTLDRTRIAELARFLAVGASSTLLYFAVYSGAILLGVGFALAAVLGFAVSAVYGYFVHERWTFRTNAASRDGLSRWLLLQGSLIVSNVAALWVLVHQAGMQRIVAQLLILPFIPLVSYALSRRLVYRLGSD